MSNITLSFEKDGSEGLIHNVPWEEKRYAKWGSQNFGVPGPVFWVVFQGIILISKHTNDPCLDCSPPVSVSAVQELNDLKFIVPIEYKVRG